VLSVIGLVGLVTIGVSSYMILYNGELYEWARRAGLLRVFRARAEEAVEAGGPRSGHVIVVGMNALGRRAIAALLQRGARVLAVDTDPAKLAALPCETLLGNMGHLPVLEEAGVRGARLVLSALQIEDANRLLAWRCRALGVPVAIHAFDQAVVRDLEDMGVDYVINTKSEALRVLAAQLAHAGVLD
jgi:Trk K+ transport system NAD-binding subunit